MSTSKGVRPSIRRLAIVACIVLVPLACHALWDYIEVRRLIREVAAIRDRGEPVVDRDLGSTAPRTDEEERAARYYLAAAALASGSYAHDRDLGRDIRARVTQIQTDPAVRRETLTRLAAKLGEYAGALDLLDKATPLDFTAFSPGSDSSYRASWVGSLSGLNDLRIVSLCLEGKSEDAAAAVNASIRLQRVLANRFPLMTGLANEFVIGFVLSYCPPSVPTLAALQRAMEPASASVMTRSLMAERVIFINSWWRHYGFDARSPEVFDFKNWTLTSWTLRPWYTGRLVRELRVRAEAIEASKQPWSLARQMFADLVKRYPQGAVPGTILGRFGTSAYSVAESYVVRDGRVAALSGAARAALAVERYRRDHGSQLPPTLDSLAPAYVASVPIDPFDGSPLRYRPRADSYVVYSVGTDATDDGGEVDPGKPRWPQGQPTEPKDVGIRVRLGSSKTAASVP